MSSNGFGRTNPRNSNGKRGISFTCPPYVIHQRFNTDPDNEARVVVVNSRIIKKMGFDWFEQLENAEGFEDIKA